MLAWLGAALLRLHARTLRLHVEGGDRIEEALRAGERVLVASWHGRILMGVVLFGRYRPVVMISQSRDGERMSRVAERLGWRTVRGSSTRGGVRALVAQVRILRGGGVGGHVVDGPRGPARQVKPGLLALAQRSGALIFPVYPSARWRIEVRSWDRMMIPLPFSRVWIRLGDPVRVPPKLPPGEAETLRVRIEQEFEREFARLDRDCRA
jgi:lysophospholipid acyltransferase (LPLAT)-like uncharacterized protein